MKKIELKPVARVRNDVKEPRYGGWEEVVSEIVVEKSLEPALEGIEDFSHIIVLFFLDRLEPDKRSLLKVRPRDREDMPLLGVFATRSQYHPNPIALTIVPLLERKGNVLVVRGLDALDGTPVLDLKPYAPDLDLFPQARAPEWVSRLIGSSRQEKLS